MINTGVGGGNLYADYHIFQVNKLASTVGVKGIGNVLVKWVWGSHQHLME